MCPVGQPNPAGLLGHKVIRRYLTPVNKAERQAVREYRPQLLHEIERQARAAGPVGVQETHLRIEAMRLQRRAAIVAEHRVKER